jgi:hypothetical protein
MECSSLGAPPWRRRFWPDAKRRNHAFFGVYYEEDIVEQWAARHPGLARLFCWRISPVIRARNLVFVHVPRAAGNSIASALYGPRHHHHFSARAFRAMDPAFWDGAMSFSVLRDPFDRFASAYAFVRGGGAALCPLSTVFREATAGVRGVDDYLSFLEDRDIFELDFVMRPQSWFVTDLQTGAPLVRDLFLLGESALAAFLAAHGASALPHLNAAKKLPLALTARQKARIERFYAGDFLLVDTLAARRRIGFRRKPLAIAAE